MLAPHLPVYHTQLARLQCVLLLLLLLLLVGTSHCDSCLRSPACLACSPMFSPLQIVSPLQVYRRRPARCTACAGVQTTRTAP